MFPFLIALAVAFVVIFLVVSGVIMVIQDLHRMR